MLREEFLSPKTGKKGNDGLNQSLNFKKGTRHSCQVGRNEAPRQVMGIVPSGLEYVKTTFILNQSFARLRIFIGTSYAEIT